MTRNKKPSKIDRDKLEMVVQSLNNTTFECSCGEDEACDDCRFTVEPDDVSIRNVDYDRLAVTIRLSDITPRSKFARRYNADDNFADIVDWIQENVEDMDELGKVSEAARRIDELNREGDEAVSAHKRLKQL